MFMLCGTNIKQKMRHMTSINSHSGFSFVVVRPMDRSPVGVGSGNSV